MFLYTRLGNKTAQVRSDSIQPSPLSRGAVNSSIKEIIGKYTKDVRNQEEMFDADHDEEGLAALVVEDTVADQAADDETVRLSLMACMEKFELYLRINIK